MTNESRPPFILPDSVQKRRRGLLNPQPRQRAEHLVLLTADSTLTSVNDMLALMQSELERLQEQIDSDEEPDRHAETRLAAATANVLEDILSPEHRNNHREVYFSLLLGYLYGRLTEPGTKSQEEAAIQSYIARDLLQREHKRQRGPQSVEEQREIGREWMRQKASEIWEQDQAQELRIGDVAVKVLSMVEEEADAREARRDESARKWPRSIDKIKAAIRSVAPPYAVKRGRPPIK